MLCFVCRKLQFNCINKVTRRQYACFRNYWQTCVLFTLLFFADFTSLWCDFLHCFWQSDAKQAEMALLGYLMVAKHSAVIWRHYSQFLNSVVYVAVYDIAVHCWFRSCSKFACEEETMWGTQVFHASFHEEQSSWIFEFQSRDGCRCVICSRTDSYIEMTTVI